MNSIDMPEMPAGEVLAVVYGVRLDWSGADHWADEPAPCRRCATPTQGLDALGAIHLSCAKAERAEEILGRRTGRLAADLIDERFGVRPGVGDVTGHLMPLAPEVRR